eukprot:1685597-Pyramimonas_sp.AAC.1
MCIRDRLQDGTKLLDREPERLDHVRLVVALLRRTGSSHLRGQTGLLSADLQQLRLDVRDLSLFLFDGLLGLEESFLGRRQRFAMLDLPLLELAGLECQRAEPSRD